MKFSIYKLAAVISIVQLFGCASARKERGFTYFNNLNEDSSQVIANYRVPSPIVILPNDILKIVVSTLDEKSNGLFNGGVLYTEGQGSAAGTLNSEGYRVDSEGFINFPVLGKVNVKGRTLEQINNDLTTRISAYAKNPIINVSIVNAQVYVLGEVGKPGSINISQRQTSIIEAIGLAGDINTTGRKDNVLLMRVVNGSKVAARVNLNDINAINSPFFYLQQDDLIIVEPTITKERQVKGAVNAWQLATTGFALISGLTSVIVLYNNVKK